jgi:Trypsin
MKKAAVIISLTLQFSASVGLCKIIRGDRLASDNLPQVQMLSDEENEAVCTATLIGPQTIITAAHCVSSSVLSYDSKNDGAMPVAMTSDPNYKLFANPNGMGRYHDIAIGILSHEITDVEPMTVSSAVPELGQTLIFAGVGLPNVQTRQHGQSQVVNVSDYEIDLHSTDGLNQAPDSGDSGGPVMIKKADQSVELISITSTSTRKVNLTKDLGPIALPLTTGSIRILNTESKFTENANNVQFIKKIAAEKDLKICGINLVCKPVYFKSN